MGRRACPVTSVVEKHNIHELGFNVFLFFEQHNYHCVCASFGTAVTDGRPAAMAPTQNSCSEISALLYIYIGCYQHENINQTNPEQSNNTA